MKINKYIDAILTVGIIFLLVVSVSTQIVFGNATKTTKKDNDYKDYIFYRFNNYYPSSVYNYEKRVFTGYPSKYIEFKKLTIPMEPLKTISQGPMNSAWPMICYDIHHTSQSPFSTADNLGVEKWRFYTDGWIEDTPAIDSNGIIYFGGCYGGLPYYLYAIYPDGTLKWKYRTGDLISGSSPAIDEEGTIYVGSWDGKLYAINSNGTLRWNFNSGAIIPSSPVIANDGTIYFGTEGDKIYAVNPNGTEKWRYTTGDWITSDPAIGDDGTVYIGSMDHYLYALCPNGTLCWRFQTGDRIYGSPSIADDGTIYIGSSWDSYLYALYPNGTLKWKYGGAGTPNNPSIGSDGTIYAGYLYNLIALNPNGTLKWDFYVGNDRFIGKSAPAISADGTIYFGIHLGTPGYSNGGEIVAVNSDGTESWRKRIANEWVDSSPSIAEDGTVYIGSSYDMCIGYLYAFGIGEFEADANGPHYGLVNQPVQFTGSARNGTEPYTWHWNFGDNHYSDEQNPVHTYTNASEYTVTLTVTDHEGKTANDTALAKIKAFNNPPDAPTISGPNSGKAGTPYAYTFVTTDPDNDEWVNYYIDWGDNSNSGWIGPYAPGQDVIMSHTWAEQGTYMIKAKAKDNYGGESGWGTLQVTMPLDLQISQSNSLQISQQSSNQLLLKMLQRLLLNIK